MDLHRLGEERSIALHARVAERLRQDPQALARARARVESWARTGAVAEPHVAQWQKLLSQPLASLCEFLTDPSEKARALRQVSPFAGEVDARERWAIRRAVLRRHGGA